ncbi:MAG: prolyl 4-hydroxylase [Burkholderiales bacterium]|jgi:prolyl 4-hydroxylase
MAKTALSSLPKEWQFWITENLARACEPGGMAAVMVRDGRFDKKLAYAAIEEARKANFADLPALLPMPEIDTSANAIRTPDRTVDVLITFAAPRIVLLGNVLRAEECDALCAHVDQRLTRSPVVANGDDAATIDAGRTSRGAMLARGETELIARIEERLAALANWPVERGEGLQVQRYGTGNEYRPHYDWFDPSMPGPRKHLERGGQRVGTFILYLCDVEQGGGTSFPGLGLEVQPKKGNAIYFANTDAYGAPDRDTLHAGMPVVKGVKFIVNKWLRQTEY